MREDFQAQSGSVVNISGGTVGRSFEASPTSVVNISGGRVSDNFMASLGSEVNISGSTVGNGFRAYIGSEVNISGGSFGIFFRTYARSDVELIGGEFILNGTPFTGSTITLSADDMFTGTLADGSAFIFTRQASDQLNGVTLTTAPLPPLDLAPRFVNTDISAGPSGLRQGQELTLQTGGVLGKNFAAVSAKLNIEDGFVDSGLEAVDSEVNISGGSVGDNFNAYAGSLVSIHGSEFFLDGAPLSPPVLNEWFTITNRGGETLSGKLLDGSPFSFVLNSVPVPGEDSFAGQLRVTMIAIPEPTSATLLLLGCCGLLCKRRSAGIFR